MFRASAGCGRREALFVSSGPSRRHSSGATVALERRLSCCFLAPIFCAFGVLALSALLLGGCTTKEEPEEVEARPAKMMQLSAPVETVTNRFSARAAVELPSEVRGPLIEDDYGDVYGVLLALTGDGFSYADLEEITEEVQQELLRVPDVAKVDIFGSQGERIYLETTRAKIAELGLHPRLVALALNRRNVVEPSGFVELGPRELPIYTSGLCRSIDEIARMQLRSPLTGEHVRVEYLAEVGRGYADPPEAMLRFNGEAKLALGVVQADLEPGYTSHGVQHDLDDAVQALELPAGYSLEWDGEAAQAAEARADVLGPVPVVLGLIALILMAQFNSYRRTAIIFLTVPLGLFGASFGLLIFRQPFGFMALLGVMSLAGMIIRNAIVMIEQIDLESERRERVFDAVLEASVSRVRPVLLAAMTTVLGMLPLAISGPFWAPMALAIMFGLAFASVLTLLVVPVLYALLFRVPQESRPREPRS